VLGLGIVGNLCAQLAQLSGARVMAWESMDSRIEIARRCGINQIVNFIKADAVEAAKSFASPYGADFAVLAFGGNANAAMKNVSQCMKISADGHRMGRVVLVGGCAVTILGGASTGNMDIRSAARTGPGYHDPVYEYGHDYPSAFVPFTTQRNLREIVTLILEKRLMVDPMTTHRLPLESAPEAADLLINTPDRALGVIFQMTH
jgi:threonine dehydrogenase-like Zn-dependent dehydrogenase